MRMIPPVIVSDNDSKAEHTTFESIANVKHWSNAWCFHSLNLSRHQTKAWSEADFVVVTEEAITVLEVKGGGIIQKDGEWYSTDKHGQTHRIQDPFNQARSFRYSLEEYLREKLGRIKALWTWAVVFPDIDFDIDSPEWEAEHIFDRRTLRSTNALADGLSRLYGMEKGKQRSKGRIVKPMTGKNCEFIAKLLRPSFQRFPLLAPQISEAMETLTSMTEEQYATFDGMNANDRIICTGGAGTGKTFLGINCAKHEELGGKTVLFVVPTETLKAFLLGQVKKHPNIEVLTYSEVSEYSQNSFDLFILDEAQDYLSSDLLENLDAVLDGGIEQGRWRIFYDRNQTFVTSTSDNSAFEFLSELGAFKFHLSRNVRNTPEVVKEAELTTGAELGRTVSKGAGTPPEYHVCETQVECAKGLELKLIEWTQKDKIPLNQIAILTSKPFRKSSLRLLSQSWDSRIDWLGRNPQLPSDRIVAATISNFKGLERPCVAIIDLDDEFDLTEKMREVYVAMTRANHSLWISTSLQISEQLDSAKLANSNKV